MMTSDIALHNHIERTRAQASHAYDPQYLQDVASEAVELAVWLTETFGGGVRGVAASIGEAQPMPNPIPDLCGSVATDAPVKRPRGRPRKS